MSIEATAEALAPETVAPVEAPEVSEDSEMESLFDKMMEDDPQEDEQKPDETEQKAGEDEQNDPEDEQEAPEAEQKAVEAPSDVPHALKQHWKDIPEAARAAVLESQREMGRKLADQGRQVQGIAPIKDVLTQAIKEIPSMADMRPADAAKEIFQLAKLSHDFSSKPVETLMGYIKQHGLGEQMQAALTGQQPQQQAQQVPQLMKHIQGLERKISQLSDPEYFRSNFETFNNQSQVLNSVSEFASKAEHWQAVENHMPAAIQYVQAELGADASAQDVLTQAYELTVSRFVPEAKAKQNGAADKAAPAVDPDRNKAALKAKSANVQSRSSGKARTMSEDELLAATYDKHMQS